jgi:hypothetical protein
VEEYVQVPVPKQFVSHVYALLAQLTAATDGTGDAPRITTLPVMGTVNSPSRSDLRYQLLTDFLVRASSDLLRLTLEQVTQICGGQLPDSAYKHRAWWANTDSHSHAQSWQRAGFRVARVEFDDEAEGRKQVSAVTFQRV